MLFETLNFYFTEYLCADITIYFMTFCKSYISSTFLEVLLGVHLLTLQPVIIPVY